MDSPFQGAKGIPVEKTEVSGNQITISMPAMNLTYKGILKDKKIERTFSQNGMELPLILEKSGGENLSLNCPQTPKPPFDYDTEEVLFRNETEGNLLAGTFVKPKNKDFPVVVMITGSRAQNRDEEIFGHKL